MIYYDSSALLKLVLPEVESEAFTAWYRERRNVVRLSSSLAMVEVVRTARTAGDGPERRAREVLHGLTLISMNEQVLFEAGVLPYDLRSLDAIHLASALQLRRELDWFVAYDHRLLEAAGSAGLPVAAPGAT